MKKSIAAGLFVAFIFWIMGKYRAFKSLDISPGLPRAFKLSGGTIEFLLPLTCFNGAASHLNIGSIDLRVFFENAAIGRALASTPQRIGPNGKSVLDIKVYLNITDMLANIPTFATGLKDGAITTRYAGVMNVEGIYANVDFSQTFHLPKF